ncbi:MAG: NAD-dependent epimerase/dehydratase family protein [Saprospiraceae bacterium]
MSSKRCLITGGAGFIGAHLANELLSAGYEVRVMDSLEEQVHGDLYSAPEYLSKEVELIIGDVRDRRILHRALRDVDVVYHLAARVGVGQSMYEIKDYTDVNNVGTATLMEELMENPVEKLIVASSMSIYGEGMYRDAAGFNYDQASRKVEHLKNGEWELYNDNGAYLQPIPTPENKTPALASVYALNKYDQERLCLIAGKAYDIPTVALRFFNVYGPYQALSNPYTGVLAIFASRFLNNKAPLIFEDGLQKRDFVNVKDVARACRLAMEVAAAQDEVFNIGSGEDYTILEITRQLQQTLCKEMIEPQVTGKYRVGDIRHCYADISKARQILGYQPQIALAEGLEELAAWLEGQIAIDLVDKASSELAARGLTI